jgi:hypothetical protein
MIQGKIAVPRAAMTPLSSHGLRIFGLGKDDVAKCR